jgi:hypothetical protein
MRVLPEQHHAIRVRSHAAHLVRITFDFLSYGVNVSSHLYASLA